MPLKLKIKPLERWPRDLTKQRQVAPFKCGYADTLKLLEKELRLAGAINVVVQLAVREQEVSIDGNLKAWAKPEHPGVILSFDKYVPTGPRLPLSFPCDSYKDWKDNLRAIALALEALRKVDRYGVTSSSEQYRGWKALPESGKLDSDREAARTLIIHAGDPAGEERINRTLASLENAKRVYREAVRRVHPEGTAPDPEAYNLVNTAWSRLQQRFREA